MIELYEQPLPTIKAVLIIEDSHHSNLRCSCRSCGKVPENLPTVLVGSSALAQNKYLQSATKLVETVANRAHWQRHIHCLQRKLVQKVRFRDTLPSPTLINVVPLSTRLVENRKTQHCPGGAGEGAICAAELEIDSKG